MDFSLVWDKCSPGILGGTSMFHEDWRLRTSGCFQTRDSGTTKVHCTSMLTDVERNFSGTLGHNTCVPKHAEYPAKWVITGRSLRPTQSSPHTLVLWRGTELAWRFGVELLFSPER